MGRTAKKLSLIFLVFFAVAGALAASSKIIAETLDKTTYQVTTTFRNNGADVVNKGSYGDSKFIITPTFRIADSVTLKKGDVIAYQLPDELDFDIELTRELRSTDATGDVHFATLTTHKATKTATIEIVDEDFFHRLGNNKTISADITAVWDRDVMPLNTARTFNLEGYGDITLTRIVVDEEPRGISKWGVQRSDDPSLIEWRIRVNRDLNDLSNVSITDEIRPGQELVGTVRGHYFHDYYNPSPAKPNVSLNASNSTITVTDNRHFTIQFEDLTAKGAFIYYQTRLTDPSTVEASTTNVYNDVTLYKDGSDPIVPFTGQAKISRIGGSGSADTTAAATTDILIQKTLSGRGEALKSQEFEFELVDTSNNNVVATARNDADGQVKFSQIRFTAEGTYRYKVREKNAGQTQNGVTYSTEEISLTITVAKNAQNQLTASVSYPPDTTLTNTYQAGAAKTDLELSVSLTGKTLTAEQFEFELVDEDGKVVATAKNTVDGTISFTDLTFDQAKTYSYKVRQKNGGQTLSGISYDPMEASVTIAVTDNNEGSLTADVTYPADKTFDNRYTVSLTSLDITAAKVLKGRDAKALAEGEFSFRLESEDGQQQYQAKNKADGRIVFEQINFDKADTYRFRLQEEKGTDSQIAYDTTVYQLEVQVTDKGDGSLEAKVVSDPITITNTYTAAKTTIPVRVAWDDADNQDGKRQPVTVRLYADGQDTGKTLELNAANQWSASFADVDADKGGQAVAYTISGSGVQGYSSQPIEGDAANGFILPYSYTPETIDITAKKNWDDGEDQDGKRPDSITVKLLADGQEVASQEVKPDADGKWEASFPKQPKYANGQLITYTVDEVVVADYSKTITDFTITNSRKPETVSYQVTKVWQDGNNQDGKRPASVTVQLFKSVAGGTPTAVSGKTLTLTAAQQTDANTWTAAFADLPRYEGGKEISYSVQEDTSNLPAGYTASVSGQTITNSYEPSTVTLSGSSVWDDADNQDGKRPEKIQVEVRDASGTVVATQDVVPAADGSWSFSFANLPQYSQGQEISYQVVATVSETYTTTVTEDPANKGQYTLTHTHAPEQLNLGGLVNWSDANDQDGLRPNQLTVTLYANDRAVATATASAASNWQYQFDPVARYENGQEIQYRIDAAAPNGYSVQIDGFTITETHVPAKTPADNGGGTSASSSSASRADSQRPAVPASAEEAGQIDSGQKSGQKRVLPRTGSDRGAILSLIGLLSLLAGGYFLRKRSL